RFYPPAETENQLPDLLWPVVLMIGWFQGHQAYTFLPHILPKTFSCIAFIAQYRKAKVVFCKVPQTLPVINGSRSDLKSSDITFYCNKGMHFKAKIGFLFGWTSSIICTVLPERTTITCASEFADRKRKTVNYKIAADRYRKGLCQFLPEQFRYL